MGENKNTLKNMAFLLQGIALIHRQLIFTEQILIT